jgi:hypothetical protein
MLYIFYLNISFVMLQQGREMGSGYSGGNLREISPLSGDDFMQKLLIQQVHDAV